eukprot:gene7283-14855_t
MFRNVLNNNLYRPIISLSRQNQQLVRYLARFPGKKSTKQAITTNSASAIQGVPPPADDPWVEVKDKSSGQIYYWNTQTNETTALGEPKPKGISAAVPAPPQQQGSMMGGLASTVAEGFAFGVGSAVARNVVGSLFGGSSSSGSESSNDGDTWDV